MLFWIAIVIALVGVALYWSRPRQAVSLTRGVFPAPPHERDPVCGALVDVARASGHRQHDGHIWWFCSEACLSSFDSAPEAYVGRDDEAPTSAVHPSRT
jgi:YHS domain-containing protein